MSVTHGMNIEEVRALGNDLQTRAGTIDNLMGTIERVVGNAGWVGPDAARFKNQWWPEHRARLMAISRDLHGFGQSALNNAAHQEQVSSGHSSTTSSGSMSAGVWAGITGQSWIQDWFRADITPRSDWDWTDGTIGIGRDFYIGTDLDPIEFELFGMEGSLYGSVGAEGSIGVDAGFENGQLGVDGGIEAFVGARAGVDVEVFENDYVGASVGAEGWVGAGFEADIEADIGWEKVDIDLDFGGAIGVGGKFEWDIELRPRAIMDRFLPF